MNRCRILQLQPNLNPVWAYPAELSVIPLRSFKSFQTPRIRFKKVSKFFILQEIRVLSFGNVREPVPTFAAVIKSSTSAPSAPWIVPIVFYRSIFTRAVLELKTKTTQIQRLKYLSHNRKTICAWSLNTERVIRDQERHTASLNARLQAAETCQSWGYPLAFHFDPVVLYEGCEAEYRHVIHRLFNRISADNIVWISIGTFRFIPELKTVIQKRFTDSTIVYGEFITGLDGKMRYFKPLRLNFYQKMVSWIRELAPNVLVYFCMESEDIWKRTMGFTPEKYGGLSRMLDLSAQKCCGLVL